MKTLKNILGIAALSLIGLTDCKREINYGKIQSKEYEAPRDYILISAMSTGKSIIPFTMYMHHNEAWEITIGNYNSNGKFVQEHVYVSKERWDTLKEGQNFCIDKNCSKENPDTKISQGN